jgi:hypothetical protein
MIEGIEWTDWKNINEDPQIIKYSDKVMKDFEKKINNDIFKINPVGIRELRYFRIVNQWGVRIFETTNLSEGWDGRLNGVREPIASYTWMIEAVDTTGQPVRESGTVTLIR